MFREMRRKQQQLPQNVCTEILHQSTSGVLALAGDDGYPYAVPLSYVYDGEKLFFHCATEGHKLDAIRQCERASLCVIAQDRIVPERYTTYYRSVIAFGRMRILQDRQEILDSIEKLAIKYTPNDEAGRRKEIDESLNHLCMLEMTIEHLTGKEAKELANQRK